MSDRVTIERDGGIADVRLNRPEKHNALDMAFFEALVETGRTLAGDGALRAVVLSGEGPAFCAGIDVSAFSSGDGPSTDPLLELYEGGPATFAQQAAYTWTELPVPVIAAVHGVCFGAGIQIALAADLRFVSPDARLSVMEIEWGLIPDVTGSQTLRHLLPLDVAKELVFTGRIVSGADAVELGLATHVSETPHAAALELAHEIADRSPDAIRAGKRLLNTAGVTSLEAGLALEADLQRGLIGGVNQRETVHAKLEKRAPKFRNPS